VRRDASYDIGFPNDLHRLKVATMRAKAGVVIVGDKTTLIGRVDEEIDRCTEGQITTSAT
jgi:hypothetical protein